MWLRQLGIHVLTVIALILSVFVGPLLLVTVIIPTLFWRGCVILLWRRFHPEGGGILTPLSAFFAADSPYGEDPLSTNLIHVGLQGRVNLRDIQDSLDVNVLQKRESNGRLVYPELQQYPVSYLGFTFWEKDPEFKSSNHIRLLTLPTQKWGHPEEEVVPDEVYIPYMKRLLGMPLPPKRSPWEIILIHNCRDSGYKFTGTMVTFRVHHSLSGGYSTMNFILDVANLHGVGRASAVFPRFPLLKKLTLDLAFLFLAPYATLYTVLKALQSDNWRLTGSPFQGVKKGKGLPREKSVAVSVPISVKQIKEIKNALEISFSSVISASIAGGIRRFMVNNEVKQLPESIPVLTPWPVKDIPDKLGNFLTSAILDYPIREMDSLERVKEIEKRFNATKYSPVPRAFHLFMELLGRMPNAMLSSTHNYSLSSMIMSNVAGPNEPLKFLDHDILTMTFVSGFICQNISLGFAVLSYNGHIRMVSGGDTTVLPTDSHAQQLLDCILQELNDLQKLATTV